MISSRRRIAAGFSSLTISPAALPISLRPSATSSGRCTKDSAIQSAPCSQREGEVGAVLLGHAPRSAAPRRGTLTPLWSDRVPPTTHVGLGEIGAALDDLEPHLAVVEQQVGAGLERREDLRDAAAARAAGRPAVVLEVEAECAPGRQLDLAAGEIAEPQLRPLHVGEDADRPAGIGFDLADRLEAGAVIVMRAVAEIEAEHVDAGVEQRADALRARAGGAESRDDLGAALPPHGDLSVALPLGQAQSKRGWRGNR